MKSRCSWVTDDPLYIAYHDEEWGRPVRDEGHLFEMLLLEGAQAGLRWITILRRREQYRLAFDGFDPQKIAAYDQRTVELLLKNPGIIGNRWKVKAFVKNAQSWLAIKERGVNMVDYLWDLARVDDGTDGQQAASRMSKVLKSEGFSFVGPTICYAFMQACGMVNDHEADCWLTISTTKTPL